MLLQFIINGLITGLLYSLLAIGFALVYNTTHIFHIAAAGIYVFAAYMFWWTSGFMPIVPAFLVSIFLTCLISEITDWLVYQPLVRKGAGRNSLLISSIGVMIVLCNTIAMLFGNMSKVIEHPFPATYELLGVSISSDQLAQAIIAIITIVSFLVFISKSRLGINLRAYGDNAVLFSSLGQNERVVRIIVFCLSGCFISLASNLTVLEVGMTPSMGMTVLINALVAMIIGGTGKYYTCLLGGILLGLTQSCIMIFASSTWQMAISFVLLLVFLFVRPQGIAGIKPREV